MSLPEHECKILPGVPQPSVGEVIARMESIPGSTRWTQRRLETLLGDGRDRSSVAKTNDGRICGFAVAYKSGGLNPFMYNEPCVILRRLFVDPDRRGRGLGFQLLSRTVATAEGQPVAWQTSERNHSALRWFARLGLEPVGLITRAGQ